MCLLETGASKHFLAREKQGWLYMCDDICVIRLAGHKKCHEFDHDSSDGDYNISTD